MPGTESKVSTSLRGIEGILITVIVGGAAYLFYRNYKKKQELLQANTQGTLANQELSVLESQGIHPSYSDSQYEGYAQALVQAMNGCGTDEDAIYSVFRDMQNKADVLKLIAVFGVRFYQPCWITQADAYAIWLINDQSYGGGISTWLSYDLSSGEIGNINTILSSKGIDFKF